MRTDCWSVSDRCLGNTAEDLSWGRGFPKERKKEDVEIWGGETTLWPVLLTSHQIDQHVNTFESHMQGLRISVIYEEVEDLAAER